MKHLALLLVTTPCLAMQTTKQPMPRKAFPITKSAPKYKRLTVEDSRFFKICHDLLSKPIMEEDIQIKFEEKKSYYEETVKEKARQYGQAAPAQEVAQPSRDHALHEGCDENL